jgi:hypothetical protein
MKNVGCKILQVIAIISLFLLLSGCATNLSKEIGKLGFTPIQPPRSSLEPGTLIVIRDLPGGNYGLHAVCWPEQAFPGLVSPKTNLTTTLEAKKHLEQSFGINGAYLKSLKFNLGYTNLNDISITLSNVVVLEYSDGDLYGALTNRIVSCADAVTGESDMQRKVLTVLQVLKADVVYHVSYNRGANVGASIPDTVLKGLQVNLGGNMIDSNNSTIVGNQLIWGIYPDQIGVKKLPGIVGDVTAPLDKLSQADRAKLTSINVSSMQ